jgi:preprotein translocase subunit YajC
MKTQSGDTMHFRMSLFLSALPLAVAGTLVPVQAVVAQAPTAALGKAVKDTQGGAVGTIVRIDGEFLILKTDKHEVRLPATSFTTVDDGLLIAMTQAQVNAAVEQTLAEADAKIVAGASVTGSGGNVVGTIAEVDDQFVTLELTSGAKVRLPRSGIAAGANGPVVGMTSADLEAAAKSANASTAPTETGADNGANQ